MEPAPEPALVLDDAQIMSNFRSIAPRPHDVPIADTAEYIASGRTSKVAIACGACRTRRTKCDGARPACKTCLTRETACEYAPPTGQLLAQTQKRKIDELEDDNERLEDDKSALYEILWYLQTASPDKATAVLQHVRAVQGGHVGAMLTHFEKFRGRPPELLAEANGMANESPSTDSTASTILGMPEVMDHPRLSKVRKVATNNTSIALLSPSKPSATVDALDGPLEMFFNCVGALFYIMNRDDVRGIIEAMRASGKSNIPLGNFISDGESLQLKTSASELAGMAAIGVVHSQLADPASAPPAELADYFYAVAKHGLDSAILYNPLRAMKICALIAMYNIVVKATVALAYTELGLSLARNHGLRHNACPPGWSKSEYDDIRRTHRTLVHLQCWLSASLDYMSDSLGSSIQSHAEDLDAPPEDMIRRECVKVTIIKATLLHRLPTKAPVPEATTLDFRAQLSKFHSQLPDWMGLGQLLGNDSSTLMTQFRPIIFYVHLFYLSAMMLLSRRLIIAYIALDAVGKAHLPREARQAIEEGYAAAQTNARVMDLMLSEGKVVQVCWLCIFTSYTAGLMTAYIATQKALHGISATDDMELLNKCIGVLSYCAQKDALAGRFRDLLNAHLVVLRQHDESTAGLKKAVGPEEANMADILFTLEAGTSSLHSTARDLLRLTHRPFSGLKNVTTQATLSNRAETTMGTHLEWEWELKGRECPDPIDAIPEAVEVCGWSAGKEASIQRLPAQEGAWSTWTPPAWQESFSLAR